MEIWFWPLAILLVLAVAAALAWSEIARSTGGKVTRHFVCPEVQRDVIVTFRSDFMDPDYHEDVVDCSEFGSGEAVACERRCLSLSKQELAWAERRTSDIQEPAAI